MQEIQDEIAPDLDEKMRQISQACQDKWTAFLIYLERCSDNQLKLECLRSKRMETQQNAYELNLKGIASDEIDSLEKDLIKPPKRMTTGPLVRSPPLVKNSTLGSVIEYCFCILSICRWRSAYSYKPSAKLNHRTGGRFYPFSTVHRIRKMSEQD